MPEIEKSAASLHVWGDEVIPDEITRLLGVSPTRSHLKGDIVSARADQVFRRKSGSWSLRATDREPEDLDGQIQELLSRTTADLAVWQELAHRFDLVMFCGLFMRSWNDGMMLSPTTLKLLADRGLSLSLDIYGPDDEEEKATP